jgi:methionyl-tRNA synthetase
MELIALILESHLIIIRELRLKFTMIRLHFFKKIIRTRRFYQVTEQLYDAKADQFLADRFVTELAQMWQRRSVWRSMKNGSTLNATDLINPKSTITGETPIMKSTKHWFYRWIVMKIS